MRVIPIDCIREGSILAKNIFDNDGRILLRKGVILNKNYLKKIKQIGIYSLYITDEYSDEEIEDVITPEIRQKSVSILKKSLGNISTFNDKLNEKGMNRNEYLKQKEETINSIKDIVSDIIDDIISKKNVMINIVDIKTMDNYTYQHCVNVAVLSLILGIKLNLTKDELFKLTTGALLHDFGKTLIPKEILLKKEKLTDEEFNLIKEHTTKGYDFFKGLNELSPISRIIVLQHHEKVDGSGYPEGREENDINRFAKIVAIADVYDALTSDRVYRKALPPNEAVEYVLGNGGVHFDFKMVQAFAECIVPYPLGTLVKLSNNDIGVVKETNSRFIMRPVVKILKSNNEKSVGSIINLMKELDIVISGIEYNVN